MRLFKRRAMALAFALAIFPLLLILGMAFMTLSGTDYGFAGQAATRIRAFYLADAGARYGYLERGRWRVPHTEVWTLATGEIRLHVEPRRDGTTLITSHGRSGWGVFKVEVVVNSAGQIQSWDEQAGSWAVQ